ncbi:MAG: hypothetical protein AAFN93_02820 [Bacteroidota bacterium]
MSVPSVIPEQDRLISKKAPENKSMDFNALRTLGVETIQAYSEMTWTDHNVHDPGITILEILAYAMTEIGFKINSPIEDLLASGNGEFLDLYRSSEALPSAPVTVVDYRKLLIDREEVRNAWITKRTDGSEVPVYYDESGPAMSYTSGSVRKITGFYDILIEFEDERLNTNLLKSEIQIDDRTYFLEVIFPYWDEMESRDLPDLTIDSIVAQTVPGTGGDTEVPEQKLQDEGDQNYFLVLEAEYTSGFAEDFGVHIQITPEIDELDREALLEFVDDANPGLVVSELIDLAEDSLIDQFIQKNNDSKAAISEIRTFIHQHRNICEDFFSFKTIRTQEIGITADIDVNVGADPEAVLAEVLFIAAEFISPLIKFRSYEEMLSLGYSVEEIFDGPLLNNGFLISEDLITGERRLDSVSGEAIIYTSDLFNLIKGLNEEDLEEGNEIIDLRNFSLANFINNQTVTITARNCLKLALSETHKPKLSILKSTIRLFKEGVEVSYDINRVIELYDEKVLEGINALQTYSSEGEPVKLGNKLDLQQYRPIQNDFPMSYGIGEDGLPENSTDLRKAQAHQLKTYLAFFDQVYTNFLSQLNHIKELFSFSGTSQRTYFYYFLSDIPGLSELLSGNYSVQLEDVIEIEGGLTQLERKNRFLNHLVARFGENPVDFRHLFKGDALIVQQKLIDLKKKLLRNHPSLSSNRFVAYNYLALNEDDTPDVWDTHNVSGYEKRVCHLLGLNSCLRRHLFNPIINFIEFYQEDDDDEIDETRFRLYNTEKEILLSGSTKYTSEMELIDEMGEVIFYGSKKECYEIKTSKNDKLYFNLLNEEGEVIARRIELFDDLEEIDTAIQQVVDFIGYAYIGEGFHLIEHILLRPRTLDVGDEAPPLLLPVVFNNNEELLFDDPYSFHLTLIIPTGYQRNFSIANAERLDIPGMDRFRDQDFRRIMERVLRNEAPAHALLHIHTLDADLSATMGDTPSLNNFERVYKNWLESLAEPTATALEKVAAQNDLIAVLNNIYNPSE